MFNVNLCVLTSLICFGSIKCIVYKGDSNVTSRKTDVEKNDNAVAQSIDRDYIAGYEDNYGHGAYGLSAHGNYGFTEGHEGYEVVENNKHYVHHTEDHPHYHDHYKHYDYGQHKALAIKNLLVPLAGIALLGAAAAFVSNPILLQLGVISASSLGRKKRDTNTNLTSTEAVISEEDKIRLNHYKLLEKFMSQIPKQEIQTEEKKILASYLSYSEMVINSCLERLACELHSTEGTLMPMEANVLTISLNEILTNNFVPENTKNRLWKAIEKGKKNSGCEIYVCKKMVKLQNKIKKSNII